MQKNEIMDNIFGRKKEKEQLDRLMNSGKSEFIAVYGRRRIGKTYLIHEYLGHCFTFYVSGVLNSGIVVQQSAFRAALEQYGNISTTTTDWMELFAQLRLLLTAKIQKQHTCVVFIDELPCFDTVNSNFLSSLDNFWNTWGVWQKQLKMIVCGSATSWMTDNLINNHGGLHNRLTAEIYLRPFTLKETEEYIKSKGINWNRQMIIETYMAFGGIPYYLNFVENADSFTQMIDQVYFAEKSPLQQEFGRLFASLFRSPEPYMNIITILAECKQGLTRKQIVEKLNKKSGGSISKLLEDLINCDFIRKYNIKTKLKTSSKDGIYALTDLFSLFHLHFSKKNITDEHFWQNHLNSPTINSWEGLAFEQVVMQHIPQIKVALGISGIGVEYYSWRSKNTKDKSQIDLILDRADNILNICEIKYSAYPYQLSKTEAEKLSKRTSNFLLETNSKKGTLLTLITTNGMQKNKNSYIIDRSLSADELFC